MIKDAAASTGTATQLVVVQNFSTPQSGATRRAPIDRRFVTTH